MISQVQLDVAVGLAYRYAHMSCHYAPTDQSFPAGEDGRMDCTGLMLRALYLLGLVDCPLNCDQIDQMMGRLGFVKSTDIEDVYRYHGFVQWCYPQWVGSAHVHHTYYSLGGDGRTISKYDTGSEARLRAEQPFAGALVDEWAGRYIFKHMWILPDLPGNGVLLKVGD